MSHSTANLPLMLYSPYDIYLANKKMRELICQIPKKNKAKFSQDLIKLIKKAHEEDYENFNF